MTTGVIIVFGLAVIDQGAEDIKVKSAPSGRSSANICRILRLQPHTYVCDTRSYAALSL